MTSAFEDVAIDGPHTYPHAEHGATNTEADAERQPEDQVIAAVADDESDGETLDELGADIQSAHRSYKRAVKRGLRFAIRAGQLLRKARPRVPKGEWGAWLAANCHFSQRSAQEYVDVARAFDKGLVDTRRAAVSLRQVLSSLRNDRAGESRCDSAAGARKGRSAFSAWQKSQRRFLELTRNLYEHRPPDLTPEVFSEVVRKTIADLEELLE